MIYKEISGWSGLRGAGLLERVDWGDGGYISPGFWQTHLGKTYKCRR